MSILNAARTTITSSLNVVTTAAVTVDKTVMAGYHAADVLESNAATWAENAKLTGAENQHKALEYRRREMAVSFAERDIELERRMQNPEFAKLYQQHLADLEQVHASVTSGGVTKIASE